MTEITEGRLTFQFPEGWNVTKYDDWSFYKNQFQKLGGIVVPCSKPRCSGTFTCDQCDTKYSGVKAIDILAIERTVCCWCIEIKDYRSNRRTKVIQLADEIALKVRDTLSALAAARINANDADEQQAASDALRCPRIRVVLHLEQPPTPSRLFPRTIDPANVLQRMKQLMKCFDAHPLVIESSDMRDVEWTATYR